MSGLDNFLEKLPYGDRNGRCRLVYVYFGIIFLLNIIYTLIIIIFFGVKNLKSADILNIKFCEIPGIGDVGGWPLSHFVAFFIAGILFPECFVLVFILGVFWEIFETVCGHLANYFFGPPQTLQNSMYKGNWVDGRVEDIIFNLVGFLAGKMIIDTYRENKRAS